MHFYPTKVSLSPSLSLSIALLQLRIEHLNLIILMIKTKNVRKNANKHETPAQKDQWMMNNPFELKIFNWARFTHVRPLNSNHFRLEQKRKIYTTLSVCLRTHTYSNQESNWNWIWEEQFKSCREKSARGSSRTRDLRMKFEFQNNAYLISTWNQKKKQETYQIPIILSFSMASEAI